MSNTSNQLPTQRTSGFYGYQFSLRHAFFVMTVISVLCAVYAAAGGWSVLLLLVVAQLAVALVKRSWNWATLAGIQGVLLAILFDPGVRQTSWQARCTNQMKQISLALHAYHEVHGHFPPAFTVDKSGQPMHSWRVLLLPFLECNSFYEEYNFEEPWDGPNNRQLSADNFPSRFFQCPKFRHKFPQSSVTNYVAIWGPRTAFPGSGKTTALADIRDGLSSTILIVEIANSDIHWMEPRDRTLEEFLTRRSSASGASFQNPHGTQIGTMHAIAADGSIQRIPATVTNQELLAAITIHGKEKVWPWWQK